MNDVRCSISVSLCLGEITSLASDVKETVRQVHGQVVEPVCTQENCSHTNHHPIKVENIKGM